MWRPERSRGNTAATRRPWSALRSTTVCWDNSHGWARKERTSACFPLSDSGKLLSGAPDTHLSPSPPLVRGLRLWQKPDQVSPQQSVTQRVWPRKEMLAQKGMGEGGAITLRAAGCSSAGRIPVAVAADSSVMFLYPKVGEKRITSLSKWWERLSKERKGSCCLILQSLYSKCISQTDLESCTCTKPTTPNKSNNLMLNRVCNHKTLAAPVIPLGLVLLIPMDKVQP